jgi:ATP-binding cassette subfamily B multidrug efflux pump
MMAMGWVTNLVQRGSASMRRINRILEEIPEIRDSAQSRSIPKITGKIEIEGLCFAYPGQADNVLKDIHLKIRAGDTLAIVGRVGAGKTTLLHAITRLLDAQSGSIFVDGRHIRNIRLRTLRKNIGFVSQEVFIFSDTIRNNVLFGRTGVSRNRLETVLQAADIFEDIKNLEKGLDTLLGERGITLSGGQRQRLTIARALILDPPILILDDALSMVDTRTEERILNQVLGLRQNKTNLIVSHRISTISRAERIAVLERGELLELGTHENLLEKGGIYTTLYEKQVIAEELEIGV